MPYFSKSIMAHAGIKQKVVLHSPKKQKKPTARGRKRSIQAYKQNKLL